MLQPGPSGGEDAPEFLKAQDVRTSPLGMLARPGSKVWYVDQGQQQHENDARCGLICISSDMHFFQEQESKKPGWSVALRLRSREKVLALLQAWTVFVSGGRIFTILT